MATPWTFDFSSPFDTWLIVSHLNKCQVSLVTLGASKNVKSRLSRNLTKFYGVTRFHKTIPTVKSVLSPKILKKFEFSTEITVLPFFIKIEFSRVLHDMHVTSPLGQSVKVNRLYKNFPIVINDRNFLLI